VKIELGELVFEELQLRHHGADKQIKGDSGRQPLRFADSRAPGFPR
jgi:hypothetical protein